MEVTKTKKGYSNLIAAGFFFIFAVQHLFNLIVTPRRGITFGLILDSLGAYFQRIPSVYSMWIVGAVIYLIFTIFLIIKKVKMLIIPIVFAILHVLYMPQNGVSKVGELIVLLMLGVLWASSLEKSGPGFRKVAKNIFWIPAVINLLYLIIVYREFIFAILFNTDVRWMMDVPYILLVAGRFFMSLWLAYPDGFAKKEGLNTERCVSAEVSKTAYCGILKHVVLLFLTFGVWLYIWIYNTTKHLNNVKNEVYLNPTKKLLLCMFVPFYFIYWTYISALRIDKLAKEKGIESDISVVCLVLAFFFPIIPPIIMQYKINNILDNKKSFTPIHSSPVNLGYADELKKFKELLDDGVITQEDFDAKKKQLLGL